MSSNNGVIQKHVMISVLIDRIKNIVQKGKIPTVSSLPTMVTDSSLFRVI